MHLLHTVLSQLPKVVHLSEIASISWSLSDPHEQAGAISERADIDGSIKEGTAN